MAIPTGTLTRVTAGGDRESVRWQHPTDGTYMVLTARGRLLRQDGSGRYRNFPRARPWTAEISDRVAAELGYERVESRGVR